MRNKSPAWRAALSTAGRKRFADNPELRQVMSERAKRLWADGVFGSPEWKAKVTSAINARWADEDYQKRMSIILEERWKNPEYREKVLQGVQEFWTSERRAARGERYTGDNNPNWRGGASFEPYPPIFNQKLKAAIRKRDEYKCAMCEMIEDEKAHDVHHIDYDKANNAPCNLITICHTCHPYTNGNRAHWQNHFEQLIAERQKCIKE